MALLIVVSAMYYIVVEEEDQDVRRDMQDDTPSKSVKMLHNTISKFYNNYQ